MARGFRVQSVEIEGFKGFTASTKIEFKGRHVFLLGQNGNGKSSIVEAIRWGLFGSAYRPNEIIKNQRYPGNCRVTVNLARDGQLWALRRTLNLGAGSSSEAVLTDQHGSRRPIRDTLPQLDSVDAGEGTHIIFAGQSAPLRRQPDDLEPFERTVLNYLGLTQPRALLSAINSFVTDQADAEHSLDERLTSSFHSLDTQLAEQQRRRSGILTAAPWGDGPPPSIVASEQRVRSFIEEITGTPPTGNLDGLSLTALVERAEQVLNDRCTQSKVSLEQEVHALIDYRQQLERLHQAQTQIREQQSAIQETRLQLQAVCDGMTSEQLTAKLAEAKCAATVESIRNRIMQDAMDLTNRDNSEYMLCPVCNCQHARQTLRAILSNKVVDFGDSIGSVVSSLESRVQKCMSLDELLREQRERLDSLSGVMKTATDLLHYKDKSKVPRTNDLVRLIQECSDQEFKIRSRIDDQDAWSESQRSQLDRLKDELRFHGIQRHIESLQVDRQKLQEAKQSYGNLVTFGESVREIRKAVNSQLCKQLELDIPRVAELLSKAFSALTQHAWYDRLAIAHSTLPQLQLRVASSRDPSGREDPTGVLNGQAESALHLVPYFAFSQAEDTPTEVYLVMLDDPTRALDTEHIRILVERLWELGRNVQLIVASQETERLMDMIPNAFDHESYTIIEPTGWSPDSGPILRMKYG